MNLHESCIVVNKLLWSNHVVDSKRRRRFCQSTGTLKTTEQNLIVYISKSETEVTNNRRLRSTEVRTVEANYRQTQPRGLSATAELLVISL